MGFNVNKQWVLHNFHHESISTSKIIVYLHNSMKGDQCVDLEMQY